LIRHDLHQALRSLRQHALISATIVITLALGIGANTAVFSLLHAMTLGSALPVADAHELYSVNLARYAAAGPEAARFSGPDFERLRQIAQRGVGVAAVSRGIARVYTRLDSERETTPASLQLASPGFFPLLGLTPALGRLLPDTDTRGAREPVAVVSYAYWQQRFGGSPDVVGRSLTINGSSFTIAGVGPRGFAGVWLETPVDIWVPLTAQPTLRYSQSFSADGANFSRPWLPQAQIWWLHLLVRVPAAQAAAATSAFDAADAAAAGRSRGLVLEPFAGGFSRYRQQFSTPLVALLIMAALVLLIACANVANLLLSRAVTRQRELAVRIAMGAGRSRLLHQLLTESVLLVVLAGAGAVVIARLAANALVRIATATTAGPPPFAAPIDLRVLAFAAAVAFASVLIFGVWPALRATRVDLVNALKVSARGTTGGGLRPARILVVLQVALSLVLVTATGLFMRSFQNLADVDLGFARERLVTVAIDPLLSGRPPAELPAALARVVDAVRQVPGVQSASLAMCRLQTNCAREDGYKVEGYQAAADEVILFSVNAVSAEYFTTVGMPLLAGRTLSDADLATTTRVAVVNKTLATRYFGDWRRAVGRHIGLETPGTEIVGIVEDARGLGNLKAPPLPSVFVPMTQRPFMARAIEVRTAMDPAGMTSAMRRAVGEAAPGLPIESIETVDARVERGLGQDRLIVLLTSGFGALALGMAGFGLFGVLSHAVARRASEIGLRMALGASHSRVLWGIVREALWMVVLGTLLGLPMVVLGGSLAGSLFFGVSPFDPLTLALTVVILAGVGAACSAIPARRAARVDPMVALRQE
jgi:predicted permease